MIPYLDPKAHLPDVYRDFLRALEKRGFEGDIQVDYASRLVAATDNSVYQLVPLAVVFPKNEADVSRLLALANLAHYQAIKISPRGGGTGTNGQSLCDGVIVDVSRYMATILETNLAEGWVRVQPGVVLDELNASLKPHGVFFAPNLSPSNRATIGGMISTDASGKGSRVYGKTSHHVLSLRSVLMDGSVLDARPLHPAELAEQKKRADFTGSIFRLVDDVVTESKDEIARTLPKLERFLTGYDLAHVHREDGTFDIKSVICGSEGTLSITTEATLKLTPLPKHRQLVAIRYANFDSALRAANMLVATNPGAIETVDDTIVGLAKKDVIWHGVSHLVSQGPDEAPLTAINLVEYESDDPSIVEAKVTELEAALLPVDPSGTHRGAIGYTVVRDSKDIAALWTLRKKGVGLLGNVSGNRRPIPFVEDTAVPPEKLADYILEFRAILDRHGLRYGMFGHVDVGCLHVRPALDMRSDEDEKLLRTISDQVVALAKKYGGVLWGEHGKGFRGEYTPTFFGPQLYEQLRRVKGAFDPNNQLNPGKLATPSKSTDKLISIDTVKRGKLDRQIHPDVRAKFDTAVHCNGNGACFDWNPDSVMCPSFLVTRDRVHSPKGRAGIMREWLRLLAVRGNEGGLTEEKLTLGRPRTREPEDFSHEVYDAMNGCLACKACATQCPIKVDVPAFRADFLAQYHSRYRRPLKDWFVAILELTLILLGAFPALFNRMTDLGRTFLERVVGIVDTPRLADKTLAAGLKERKAPTFDLEKLKNLKNDEKSNTVVISQDIFTTYYEPNIALATYDVLTKLGITTYFLPIRENGKGLHIKGFLNRFSKVAAKNAAMLREVAELDIPIIGLEPAVTLTYRDEYPHALGAAVPRVKLLQEYLVERVTDLEPLGTDQTKQKLRLFGHCTERTAEPTSQAHWQRVFRALNVELESATTGCCGMCGVYGHEAEHLEDSKGVFEASWKKALAKSAPEKVLVTGHSCRSQVKRFGGFLAKHPIESLYEILARPAKTKSLPSSSKSSSREDRDLERQLA